MLKNELIELEINVAYVDEYGDTVNNITYKQVWAERWRKGYTCHSSATGRSADHRGTAHTADSRGSERNS